MNLGMVLLAILIALMAAVIVSSCALAVARFMKLTKPSSDEAKQLHFKHVLSVSSKGDTQQVVVQLGCGDGDNDHAAAPAAATDAARMMCFEGVQLDDKDEDEDEENRLQCSCRTKKKSGEENEQDMSRNITRKE